MRKAVSIVVGAALSLALATPALAAAPNNKACLGHDVSGYAAGGVDFGAFVSGLASTGQGVGKEIQAHLAGQVPDSVLPNSCND